MQKTLLIILDGFGYSTNQKEKNPLFTSKLPFLKSQSKNGLLIHASGVHVGLPPNKMGNSEVGHLTIGAGRIILQDIMRINKCIEENKLEDLIKDFSFSPELHFIGLVSDGGIHSHINHLKALVDICRKKCKNVYIHFIADGRDTAPRSFEKYFDDLNKFCDSRKNVKIASVGGRYFCMDRNNNMDRIEEGYRVMTNGKVSKVDLNVKVDENIKPVLLCEEGKIKSKDTLFFFNFRADRMKQIVNRFLKDDHKIFTMTEYDDKFEVIPLFRKEKVKNTLSQTVSEKYCQCHIAETEKFAHVTYFFNGNEILPVKNEKRRIVDSPSVKNYEDTPEMSTYQVCKEIIDEMSLQTPFIVANLASSDMIGHTGNYNATCKAIEIIDKELSKVYQESIKYNYKMLITADHGDCEEMFDSKGNISTKHTSNKVPFIFCKENSFADDWCFQESSFGLSDIAPTVLNLLGLAVPSEMTGKNIFE